MLDRSFRWVRCYCRRSILLLSHREALLKRIFVPTPFAWSETSRLNSRVDWRFCSGGQCVFRGCDARQLAFVCSIDLFALADTPSCSSFEDDRMCSRPSGIYAESDARDWFTSMTIVDKRKTFPWLRSVELNGRSYLSKPPFSEGFATRRPSHHWHSSHCSTCTDRTYSFTRLTLNSTPRLSPLQSINDHLSRTKIVVNAMDKKKILFDFSNNLIKTSRFVENLAELNLNGNAIFYWLLVLTRLPSLRRWRVEKECWHSSSSEGTVPNHFYTSPIKRQDPDFLLSFVNSHSILDWFVSFLGSIFICGQSGCKKEWSMFVHRRIAQPRHELMKEEQREAAFIISIDWTNTQKPSNAGKRFSLKEWRSIGWLDDWSKAQRSFHRTSTSDHSHQDRNKRRWKDEVHNLKWIGISRWSTEDRSCSRDWSSNWSFQWSSAGEDRRSPNDNSKFGDCRWTKWRDFHWTDLNQNADPPEREKCIDLY